MAKIGWGMLILFALFLMGASAAPKFIGADVARQAMEPLGWPPEYLLMIGVIEVVLALLVLWPRTALLGGILTMGLLGGALASNLRVGMPLYSHTLFSIYLGVWMWVGIWLRDAVLRSVLPFASR
jgi:hypothetical protein